MVKGAGVDIHGGLRVYFEYKQDGCMVATHSAEAGVDVAEDVRRAITEAEQRIGFLREWFRVFTGQYYFSR